MKITACLMSLLLALLVAGCTRSEYHQLIDYRSELEPYEEELQALIDQYNGARLNVPRGFGPRLPMGVEEADLFLERARWAADGIAGTVPTEAAAELAPAKVSGSRAVAEAAEEFFTFIEAWSGRVPEPREEPESYPELPLEEQQLFRRQLDLLDETFAQARLLLLDSAFEMARAILAARGEI